MGGVALLREGEVVIAKKIEGAENKIPKNILDINMGIQALQQTAEAFVARKCNHGSKVSMMMKLYQ